MSREKSTRRIANYYLVGGVLFGACFPAAGLLVDLFAIQNLPFSIRNLILVFSDQPLHWIIAMAPLVLGLAGSWIGVRQDQLNTINHSLEETIEERTRELSRSHELLEREKLYFETLVESSPIPIVVLDHDHCIQEVNPAFEKMFGFQEEKIKNQPLDPLISNPENINEARNYTSQVAAGETISGTGQRITRDGRVLDLKIYGVPIMIKGEMIGVLGIYYDITELLQAKKAAEKADLAKSEFLANMSHEIRTPMNGIMGMIELTLDSELTKEQRDFLSTARESAEALLFLINDILDYSKIEAGQLDMEIIDFDLISTVEGVAQSLAHKADEKSLEMTSLIEPELPSGLRGDPGRLRQALLNLVGNAIKFTESGEVSIRAEMLSESERDVFLKFSVTDTGIGIPEDRVQAIFERFQQADGSTTRKFGGSGLGLAITTQLVSMMGGEIGVESEVGKGSCFWFTVKFEKQPVSKTRPVTIPMPLRGVRILGVDDNPTNRLVLEKTLQKYLARIDMIAGGTQVLEKLEQAEKAGDQYRIILLDMQMPEMDGEETLELIKSSPFGGEVEVIILTSMGKRGDAARLQEMGCAGYLVKPIQQRQLVEIIGTVLGQSGEEPLDAERIFVTKELISEQKRNAARILLAEDNLVNQKLAVALLKRAHFPVDVVGTGREAVRAVQEKYYNLVLMDIQMPEMDGFEATRSIRESEKAGERIPIIAMTAHAMKGDRERCLEAGMDDYISKPLDHQELYELLGKWNRADWFQIELPSES